MKKSLFLASAGVAGLLLCTTPTNDANAEVNLNINIGGPRYAGDYGPDFIYLDDYGFAVSWGWDYDVIRLGNFYFIYRDGGWFRSPNYRGPWAAVSYWDLPYQIRRHRWNDIRRRRDREYYRYDRAYWDRYFRDQRARYGDGPFYAGDYGPDFIYLDDYGFAVSYGWDYDIIQFGNVFFIYRDGGWFRSPNYWGPWAPVRFWDLPYQIRRHNWNDIRRLRDREYNRHDKAFWDRHFEEQRIRDHRDGRDRRPDGRPDFRPNDRPEIRSNEVRPDGRPDFKPLPPPQPQPQPQSLPQGRPDERMHLQNQPQMQPQGQPGQKPQNLFDRTKKRDDGQRKDRNNSDDRKDNDGKPDGWRDGR